MKYKKIKYKVEGEIYDFEYYNLNNIEDGFGSKKKYRIGKFLSLLYKKRIRLRGSEEGDLLMIKGFVYVSKKQIEGILGIDHWEKCIKSLSRKNIISYRRDKSNKFDSRKKLWFFKLNDEFFNCDKKRVKIDSGVLNKYLDKENDRVVNEFIKNNDEFVLYEKYCCINSDLVIDNLDNVINIRIQNKLSEIRDKISWVWLSDNKKDKLKEKIKDIEKWKVGYRIELENYYEVLINDLENLKKDNLNEIGDNYFKRDGYGKRLYNIYSRVIREFREYIKIDGEEVVELDIKSCFLSLLYVFIKRLNSNINDSLVIDVKSKLLELNNGNLDDRNGIEFIDKFKSIFEDDGIFYKDEVEFSDYYDLIRLSYGESIYKGMSRRCFKELVFSVLFSDNIKKRGIKVLDEGIDNVENRLFGVKGKNLINDIKKIGLNSWIENKGGRRKKYNRGNNISLLLMMYENIVMDILRLKLMDKNMKYISVFDSLIVKKSEYKEIFKLGNSILKDIDKSLNFSIKTDTNFEDIVSKR